MSILQEVSPRLWSIRSSEQVALTNRAAQITVELQQGVKKPYKDVIDVSWGDPHRGGLKPLTFVRQVIARCLYPSLLTSESLPVDVQQRAQSLLGDCGGGSVGAYTATAGIPRIVRSVSEFITRRDGGVESLPENIFISNGSQRCLMMVLKLFIHTEGLVQTGVLMPVPSYPYFNNAVSMLGGVMVPYYLDEEHGWDVRVDELRRALRGARGHCNPMVLYVTNPGNPTGHVQNKKSIEDVIQFAAEEKLFLLADEVYQDSVHDPNSEFVAYKKVLSEMGPPYSNSVELASFHSASKGYLGESGFRGGYVEFVNLDPTVMGYVYTLFSADSTSSVLGQLALDLLAHPPRPGDPSYPTYAAEIRDLKDTMGRNVQLIHEVIGSLSGMSCQPIKGGIFAFPRLHLPPSAVQQAQEEGVNPDMWYSSRLLEEAGLCVGPGCEHGQREGTHHIRLCIATSQENLEEVLTRLSDFQRSFMRRFSSS
ncbi:alanine aminotransferase 2-like [Engraulis encrasicolus]|uniref:alanine aminotransferase 2-like n=1 Tax=Engraulis encrasicolus TaxID=184585 RepID=UPI002FD71298